MYEFVDHPWYGNIPVVGIPVKLSDTPGKVQSPAPDLGQHNSEVYQGLLGLTEQELDVLRKEKVI